MYDYLLRATSVSLFAFTLVFTHTSSVIADDAATAATSEEAPMTPEEQAEKAHRHLCEIQVCQILANKKAEKSVACDVVKTWRKERIEQKYLRNAVSWPWGAAHCKTDIKLDGNMLAGIVNNADYETKLEKHNVACELDQTDGAQKYAVTFSIAPVITWKDGKATKVVLNLADINGSALAEGGLWTIAKANEYLGVLDGPVVEKINEFVGTSCKDLLSKQQAQAK